MPNYRIYTDPDRINAAARAVSEKVVRAILVGPAVIVETSEALSTAEMIAVRQAVIDVKDAIVKEPE